MSYDVGSSLGDGGQNLQPEQMRAVLEDLDPSDPEHGEAWLCDEWNNALSYDDRGVLCLERQGHATRHLTNVSTDRALELWMALADGRLDVIEAEPWVKGTQPPITPEQQVQRRQELDTSQLHDDLLFYESLGAEREGTVCRETGCTRGRILQSAFCRVHHFEAVERRPCPFTA